MSKLNWKGTEAERFWQKVKITETGCWQWTAGRCSDGRYAQFKPMGSRQSTLAHIWAYKTYVGNIPDGFEVDHLCKNTLCVNPLHLEAVTPRVNTLRSDSLSAINARKTACKRGHEFTPENTRVSGGQRQCRMCCKLRARAMRNGEVFT